MRLATVIALAFAFLAPSALPAAPLNLHTSFKTKKVKRHKGKKHPKAS
ncbi:MAG: hypothetical protein JO108_26995 [Acidobacteriaceae bacterium]|nr:hypothetical protein [Acidobacteriaceae bacterium]